MDAAIATALALGVINPSSSGIGGGGFAIVYVAAEKTTYAIDFREIAPAQLTPDKFVVDGKVDPSRATSGGLAVGVPGEVAGLAHLSSRFGKLAWKQVVRPAEALANEGFETPWFFAYTAGLVVKRLPADHPFAAWLRPRGKPIREGQTLRRSSLGRTLKQIRLKGADGFYTGKVAEDIAATVKKSGGVMTVDDLKSYQVVDRDPLFSSWRDLRLATMPLPSSGGIVLFEMLGILEATRIDLSALGHNSSAAIHVQAEVLKHGFADRARFLGDAEPATIAAGKLLDPGRLKKLAKRVNKQRVLRKPADYGDKALGATRPVKSDSGTSHLCVIDRHGNAVALTTTINGYYGARLVASDSGVVLNNEMDDFALEVGRANQFGLVQSQHNLVGPGKRPLSSMTPLLVFRGDAVVACLGGSGGPRIIANVFQVLLNIFEFGMDAREAVDAPRFHHQWMPHQLELEPDLPRDVRAGLTRRGHKLGELTEPTAIQIIHVMDDGTREAASDPRKAGEPAAE